MPEVGEPAPVGVQQPLGVEPVEVLGAEVAAYGPSTWKGETNPSGFRSTNTAGE